MKTNAARLLDTLGVTYELRDYDVDESDLSAVTVAQKVGLPPAQVWKTLCVRGDKHGVVFAVIAADAELDLKALAKLADEKKIDTLPLKDLERTTGFIRGGVTAIGGKKKYPVFVDEAMRACSVVAVSAGVRGTQIVLAPSDYLRATNAKVGSFARPAS